MGARDRETVRTSVLCPRPVSAGRPGGGGGAAPAAPPPGGARPAPRLPLHIDDAANDLRRSRLRAMACCCVCISPPPTEGGDDDAEAQLKRNEELLAMPPALSL